MVSAWASRQHLVLGQDKVAEKSNEITAIPALLRLLDVEGCLVSIGAIGAQKAMAQQVVALEATTCWRSKKTSPTCWRMSKACSPGPTASSMKP